MAPVSKKVVIIGGGITGLAAAFRLQQLGADKPLEITLFDASERLGGVIETIIQNDCLIECGPDSMLSTKPAGVTLMKEVGLENEIALTSAENRRAFIASQDSLLPMPEGFRLIAPQSVAALTASPCLSMMGKLRAICEPLVPRHSSMCGGVLPEEFDESLSSFVSRRLGRETLDRLAQPLFSGIYTANPDKLSLRATMPMFLEYEAEFGSVVRGLRAKQSQQHSGDKDANGTAESVRYSMFVAPERGMGSLVGALEESLGNVSLQKKKAVKAVRFQSIAKQWHIDLDDGRSVQCDAIVFCLPAKGAARLLQPASAKAAQLLFQISYASSAVINFIVERANVLHPLDGFGFVVPAKLKKNILAASFSSVKFHGRAPQHLTVLRAFAGGALFPEMMDLSDSQLREKAFADLSHYLSIRSPARGLPYLEAIVSRWSDSMPQYDVGHLTLVKQIQEEVGALSGAFICGAAYRGVGIPDCIADANRTAHAVMKALFD